MGSRTLLAAFMIGAYGPATAATAPSSPFKFTEPPGDYAVGLRVVNQVDTSRHFGKQRARELQTLVWYPAKPNTSPRVTVGDYVNLTLTEARDSTVSPKGKKPENYTKWTSRIGASLGEALTASRDAKPARGQFPVVIYAASDSAVSWENADLCEYLASHGYVVVASPSMGATTREMTDDLPGIDAQARDISFLISYAKTLPDTDLSAVAVVAFSWGGISNLFAAARDPRIDALVALDGSMRYFPGLVKAAGDVHPEQMTIPLLFFTEGEITLEQIASHLNAPENAGPNVLNAWTHGDLFTVEMFAMAHQQFSSMLERRQTHDVDDERPGYTWDEGSAGYVWVARYTLGFLDAYLKHEASSLARLKAAPAANGVPKHVMDSRFRAADTPAAGP
jgi:pimeloyl-ACP methyl ester carboxylesterase